MHYKVLVIFVFISVLPAKAQAGAAITPANNPVPLPVKEIAAGIFVFQGAYQLAAPANGGAIANIGFVVGDDAVAVIDTGGSFAQGERLKAAIRARTAKPIRYVINTHMHPDHVLGNAAFENEAQITGHAKLTRALQARGSFYLERAAQALDAAMLAGTKIVLPDVEVSDRLTIDLGNRKLVLEAHPTAHTDNDLTVYDEKTGTLFAGDLLFVRHTPALDGSLTGWLEVMKALKEKPVLRAVPGHGPPSVPWPEAMEPQQRYLSKLAEEIRHKIKEGVRLAEAARNVGLSEQDAWVLFEEYHARNVSAGYAELEWE